MGFEPQISGDGGDHSTYLPTTASSSLPSLPPSVFNRCEEISFWTLSTIFLASILSLLLGPKKCLKDGFDNHLHGRHKTQQNVGQTKRGKRRNGELSLSLSPWRPLNYKLKYILFRAVVQVMVVRERHSFYWGREFESLYDYFFRLNWFWKNEN